MYIALITIVGFVLRLILSNQSFWLDEGASVMLARLPLSQLIEGLKADFHPPLFYALLHYWLPVAGMSEWLIRLPFIVIATATIPVLYLLCREIFGGKSSVPLIASIFLALNPLHIYYSQELRMYSMVTLLVLLSWLFLIKKNYFLTAIFNILGIFTFYGAVFSILSQAIYLLFSKSKRTEYLQLVLPPFLAFLLWWPVFGLQLQNGGYLKSVLPGWQTLSGTLTLKSLFLIPIKFIFGRTSLSPDKMYYLTGGLLLFLFGIISLRSLSVKKSKTAWIGLLAPLILGALISLKTPVLGYWRFLFVLPFFLTVLAAGVEQLPKTTKIATVLWIGGVFLFFNIYFWTSPRFHREDWRGLATLTRSEDPVLVLAFPYRFVPLEFYSADTKALPALTPQYQLKPDLPTEVIALSKAGHDFLLMDYLADLTDPERKIYRMFTNLGFTETVVYNLNNLGQVRLFQKYENSN